MNPSTSFENYDFSRTDSINIVWRNLPEQYPPHWHTYYEIVLTLEGEVGYQIGNQIYRLGPKDLLFIWPGEIHSVLNASGGAYLIVQIADAFFPQSAEKARLLERLSALHYIPSQRGGELSETIKNGVLTLRELFPSTDSIRSLRMRVIVYQILLNLYDAIGKKEQASQESSEVQRNPHSMEAISKACTYITENCDQELTLDAVAAYAGLSRYHFSRSFKECMHVPFVTYLSEKRIARAVSLLSDPEITITQAAFRSGFSSIASFNRCFRKFKSCTPTQYRKLYISEYTERQKE